MNLHPKHSQHSIDVNNLLIACFFWLAIPLLSGCGSSYDNAFAQNSNSATANGATATSLDSTLVGMWEPEGEQRVGFANLDLLKDGMGICDYGGEAWAPGGATGIGSGFTWRTEGDRLYAFFSNGMPSGSAGRTRNAAVWNYSISGTKLTLTDGETSVSYKRK